MDADMGIKRPHHNHSTPESLSQGTTNHLSKRRKSNHFAPTTTKPASVNQLKSKIRDLTRVLEHSDHLPADVRVEKERALAGYKQDVEKISKDKRRNELIKKYHMVRFFERQKATRALKKLQKRFDASSPDMSEHNQLTKEVQDARIDVNYTIYYPLTEKYQSLFPRQGDTGGEKTSARRLVTDKPTMWKFVEQCTADGTLEALRDGKLTASIPVGNRKPVPERATSKRESKNSRAGSNPSKSAVPQEQHEESDGGFFEE